MKNMILSYPRSGNTWARYCIEVLTGSPTKYPESPGDNPIGARLDIGVNLSNDIIAYKSHNISDIKNVRLLIIVRDFKEAIPRHYLEIEKKRPPILDYFDSQTLGLKSEEVDYVKILQQYDLCKNDKLLIYYEDLIMFPKPTIKKMVGFFSDISDEKYEDFFSVYDEHRSNGIKAYHATSRTRGDVNKLKWHQSRLKHRELKEMVYRLKSKYPLIWNKYLKRYD